MMKAAMSGLNTGQTIGDRINAARYALTGQGLERTVCKATTEEMIAPKKKHIDYLLMCTNEPNVSIPQLASTIIERSNHPNWVVSFKSLVTAHHLMCFGSERFTQFLASSNSVFNLDNYLDKNGPKGYEMSVFIRRYAKYLNTKAASYRALAFDPTKIKRSAAAAAAANQTQQKPHMGSLSSALSQNVTMQSFNADKLLKILPIIQAQVDHLVEFDCNASDLMNGIIHAAVYLLFKDLIRIFATYNEGVIKILETYFELTNKRVARETLDIYKKFIVRMDKIGDFFKISEQLGIERGEIPTLAKPPATLIDAMDQHLALLEGEKATTGAAPVTTTSKNSGGEAVKEEESTNKVTTEMPVNNPFLSFDSPATKQESATSSSIEASNSIAAAAAVPTADTAKSAVDDDLFSLDPLAPSNTAAAQAATSSTTSATTESSNAPAAASNPFADFL